MQARCSAEGLLEGGGSDKDATSSKKDSGAALVQKVLKQEKELSELRASVKALKAQSVQDQMTITRLNKSNLSNEGLKKQLDAMLQAEREREMREAAELVKEVEKEPVIEPHDHNACLEEMNALQTKMLAAKDDHDKLAKALQDEIVRLTGNNSSLMESGKSLSEENESLRDQLSKWEIKFRIAMKTNDEMLRASQEKIHLAQLDAAASQQQSSSDLTALQDELNAERHAKNELELKNADLLRQLKGAEEALKNARGVTPSSYPRRILELTRPSL